MSVLVQCVPNISEGRRQDVVEAVVDEVRKTTGVHLLITLPMRITTAR